MSLRDLLLLFSDTINKAIDLLLDLPLWAWGLTFVTTFIFRCVQNQIFLHERKEIDKKINFTIKKERKQ